MGIKDALSKARRSKKHRIGFLVGLLAILLLLAFWWGKGKAMFLVLAVIIVGAIGLELTDWDLDLGALWETGSLTESRVENVNGVRIIGEDCISNNLNCADFATQTEAQERYNHCAEKIVQYNADVTNETVMSLDIYGLDRNNNGIVCEALPAQ